MDEATKVARINGMLELIFLYFLRRHGNIYRAKRCNLRAVLSNLSPPPWTVDNFSHGTISVPPIMHDVTHLSMLLTV